MSTTRKIAHNTAAQVVGKIISTIIGLAVIGMMSHYLPKEQFGWYITVMAFLQFVGILIDFGLTPVTAQMMSEPAHDKNELFKNLLGFRCFSAIFFLGLSPLVALLLPYPTEVKIAISFTSLAFVAIAINQVLIGLYQTKLKMHIVSIGEVVGRVILLVGIWLVIKYGYGFLPVMGVVTVASLAYTAVLWYRGRKEISVGLAYNKKIYKAIMTKMWPIAISIIFNVVYLKGDLVLLSVMVPQTDVAAYGAAYRVLDVMTQSAMMLMGILLPLLAFAWSRNDKVNFKKYYQQSFDVMMLFAIPMTVGTVVISEKIMIFIFGDQFSGSGHILAILAIAVFGVYLGAIFGHTAVAINKQKQTMWIYISNALITLTGYLVFIPIFGLLGAAWMSVFSELYAGIFLFLTVRHFSHQKLNFKTFNKIILASAIMGVSLLYSSHLHVLILVLIAVTIYSLLILTFGVVSKQTISEILSLKRPTQSP